MRLASRSEIIRAVEQAERNVVFALTANTDNIGNRVNLKVERRGSVRNDVVVDLTPAHADTIASLGEQVDGRDSE